MEVPHAPEQALPGWARGVCYGGEGPGFHIPQRNNFADRTLCHDRQAVHLQSSQKDLIGFLERHWLGGDQGDGPLDLVVHQKILAGQLAHHGDDL